MIKILRNPLLIFSCVIFLMGCDKLINPFDTNKKPKIPGQRLLILSESDQQKIDFSLQNSLFEVPVSKGLTAWPVQQANSRHFINHIAWKGAWTPIWKAKIGDVYNQDHPLQTSPIIAANRVFVMDKKNNVTSANLKDGAILWQFKNKTDIEFSTSFGGGLALGQGIIVMTTGYGDIIGLEALTGVEKWRVSLRIPIRSAATIHQNQAIIQTIDSQAFAFNLADGSEIWYHAGVNDVTSVINKTSPASDGQQVYLAYNSGEVAAIDPESGEHIWLDALNSVQRTSELAQINTIGTSPIVINQALLVSGYGDQMVLFNTQNGQRIWEAKIGTLHMPWVSNNVIFVLGNDQRLYGLDLLSGKLRWITNPDVALHQYQQEIAGVDETNEVNADKLKQHLWSAPMMVDNNLQLLSDDGTMLKIDPQDGSISDIVSLKVQSQQPPIYVDGTAIILEQNGTVQVFR